MKKFITIITIVYVLFMLLVWSLYGYAQTKEDQSGPSKFTLSTEVAQGFVFKDYHNPQWYSASISVVPKYSMLDNKLFITEITMAIFSDGLTDYYAGGGLEYKIYEKKNYNIQLMASALIGTRDSRLYGGGIKLESGDFYLTATGRQEYNKKEFYFSGGFGINLF